MLKPVSLKEAKIYHSLEKGYDKAASVFSSKRQYPWQELAFIKQYFSKNNKLLDFGCGNGRLTELLEPKPKNYLGVDSSKELIKIAKKKYPELSFKVLNFPFEKESNLLPANHFDLVLTVAVFHHFPPGQKRQIILRRLQKTLKPGGYFIATVWNLNQPQYQKYFRKKQKEGFIPFKSEKGELLFERYHYRWELEELADFIKAGPFKIVKAGHTYRRGKIPSNLFVVAQKPRLNLKN